MKGGKRLKLNKKKYIGTILTGSSVVSLALANVGQQNAVSANNLVKKFKEMSLARICAVPLGILSGIGIINGIIVSRQQENNVVEHKYGGSENIDRICDENTRSIKLKDIGYHTFQAFIYGLTFGLFGKLTDFSGEYKEFKKNCETSGLIDEKGKKDAQNKLPFKHFGKFTVDSKNVNLI